ncbi:mRNA decay activator protein ZFP36L1-like [Betta splendens]|uniref:mRNA decay activator protein ZFP36 n=1 Tax=Betta splendens TaxID=158456 RepID=A0A6P7LRW6_BETSP|nr:mRNA decay activator protein ZFP36L1-like [Betta splendens]
MTASAISPALDYREASPKSSKMNYSSDSPQLTSVPCSSASLSSGTSAGPLLDRTVAGAPSPGAPFQRRYSASLPSGTFTGFKTHPSALMDSNKENRFRQRSYSELGDRLRPAPQVCLGGSSQVNPSRYKTELCRPFEESGTCKYGDKCQFAHGMHELRSLSRHPKYKTELCRTFHTAGFCPYGPRCHFIHNAEERCGPPPLSAFNKMARPRLQHSFSFAGFPSCSGSMDSPASVSPPPMFAGVEPTEWLNSPISYSSRKLTSLYVPSLVPTNPCPFQPAPESPPSHPDSLPDQEGYQSSLGSQSDPESPLLDASRRLPIFSRLSVSDD